MISRSIRSLLAVAFVLGIAGGTAACNTVEGFGKDISAAGRALGAESKNN